MRTIMAEGLIVGCAIGGTIAAIRLLIPNAPLQTQVGMLLLMGAGMSLFQLLLILRRAHSKPSSPRPERAELLSGSHLNHFSRELAHRAAEQLGPRAQEQRLSQIGERSGSVEELEGD